VWTLRDTSPRNRRRRVPCDPRRRRAADHTGEPEGSPARPGRGHVRRGERRGPPDPDRITLAAADNYRIAITVVPGLDAVEETSIVVPARSYAELARVLSDTDDPVEIILSAQKNQVLFHVEGVDLVSRLIDGQFPNYQQVLPATYATRVELDRDDLLKAVRLAAYIASASANIVKVQVAPDGAPQVTVGAVADVGDHQGVVDATIEGDGTTIAFNARYLGDVLQNVDADRFIIELNGPLSPGVFRPADGRDYTHVVMPVRTTS
jgi:DNA polymerase-3 subunit beta